MNTFELYSKESIETGKMPISDLLEKSLYYPACGFDGEPVRFFNEHYSDYGVNSYVYVDYSIDPAELDVEQETFAHYHIFAVRELKETDLVPGTVKWQNYASILTEEEITRLKAVPFGLFADRIHLFGRWIVYERNRDDGDKFGPERFSLLFVGGEGVATYAAMYLSWGCVPKVLTIIRPGFGFGGNYTDFRDPESALMKVIGCGKSLPELLYFGNGVTFDYSDRFDNTIWR